MSIKLNRWGEIHNITFEISSYKYGGGLAILMNCEEGPYAALTVNLEEFPREDNNAFVDTNNLGNEIVDWIIENDLGELTGRIGTSGYCIYPEVAFNINKIKVHEV